VDFVVDLLLCVLLCVLLYWIGRIFYTMQKGLNEIIAGLSAIDERLARLERGVDRPDR
jgi:hypothetical protein